MHPAYLGLSEMRDVVPIDPNGVDKALCQSFARELVRSGNLKRIGITQLHVPHMEVGPDEMLVEFLEGGQLVIRRMKMAEVARAGIPIQASSWRFKTDGSLVAQMMCAGAIHC